ncbi:hypothetical protein OIDMADRAFT_35703 [Oidiodendron maius Zn]|uniref:Uncharacterized protein n=1 Tax=Oidiodendron maius (strain Zn) TaxID=913774 RepID=A0A0C3GTB3_OIDMZ|nr:hypothetical protein OIDMADRAFT_35703 [Oidiodendron maius Zn]
MALITLLFLYGMESIIAGSFSSYAQYINLPRKDPSNLPLLPYPMGDQFVVGFLELAVDSVAKTRDRDRRRCRAPLQFPEPFEFKLSVACEVSRFQAGNANTFAVAPFYSLLAIMDDNISLPLVGIFRVPVGMVTNTDSPRSNIPNKP